MRITKPFHSRNVRSIVRLAPVRLQSAPNLVVSCVAATATPDLLLLSLTNIHNKLWYHIGLCHPARIFLNRLHEAEIYEPSGILWKELRTKRKPLLCLYIPVDFNRQTEEDLQETWARLTRQWRQQQQWPVVLGGRYGHSRPPIWSDTAPRPQSQQQWRCVAYILQSSHKLSSVSENKISSKNSQYLKIIKGVRFQTNLLPYHYNHFDDPTRTNCLPKEPTNEIFLKVRSQIFSRNISESCLWSAAWYVILVSFFPAICIWYNCKCPRLPPGCPHCIALPHIAGLQLTPNYPRYQCSARQAQRRKTHTGILLATHQLSHISIR